MKRIALAAFLLACLTLHARPALADTERFVISNDRQTMILGGTVHQLPPQPREAYYAVKNSGGVAAMYLNTVGQPSILDQGNSFVVADSFGCGVQCLTYDSSNNLDVNVKAGTVSLTLPYSMTADAQTATAASAIGLTGFNQGTGKVDRVQTQNTTTSANLGSLLTTEAGGLPIQLTATDTNCDVIQAGAGRLISIVSENTAQTVTVGFFNDSGCTTKLYGGGSLLLGAGQVIFVYQSFSALYYKLSNAAGLTNVHVTVI